MTNLIIQTYTTDDIDDRQTKNFTYQPFPDLEEASVRSVQWYADKIGAEYIRYTGRPSWTETYPGRHWHRMVMFDSDFAGYDNILYLDHDLLINPGIRENIFNCKGVGVQVAHPDSIRRIGWAGFNGGVMKLNRKQLDAMAPVIHDYYQPQKNQEALNWCYKEVMGKEPRYLDYKWNVTHKPSKIVNIRHYPGYQRQNYRKEPLFHYWKQYDTKPHHQRTVTD